MSNTYIKSVQINEFDGRFVEQLHFGNGLNIISGENGTGKTKTLINLKTPNALVSEKEVS